MKFEKGNKAGVRFPEQSTEGRGRPKTKKFRDLLEDLSQEGYELSIPRDAVRIEEKRVIITLPSDMAIAANLRSRSVSDVKWFEQLAKVSGLYAPSKVAETDSEGNDIPREITVKVIK